MVGGVGRRDKEGVVTSLRVQGRGRVGRREDGRRTASSVKPDERRLGQLEPSILRAELLG